MYLLIEHSPGGSIMYVGVSSDVSKLETRFKEYIGDIFNMFTKTESFRFIRYESPDPAMVSEFTIEYVPCIDDQQQPLF